MQNDVRLIPPPMVRLEAEPSQQAAKPAVAFRRCLLGAHRSQCCELLCHGVSFRWRSFLHYDLGEAFVKFE